MYTVLMVSKSDLYALMPWHLVIRGTLAFWRIWPWLTFCLGCEVSVEWNPQRYLDVLSNNTLAELYQSNAKTLGVEFHGADFTASTDMGNVSHVVPSIHPMYSINTTAPNHSHAFTTAAATEVANQKTLVASKVMAMTAIDVLCDSDVIAKVRNDFELQK